MSSIDEDKDRGWMGQYIRVRTRDLIQEEKMSFPEKWNFDRVTRDAVLRPSSGDEGNKSPVLEQGKEKKRRASSRPEDPKPKTRKVRRKIIALSIDSVQRLREEEEEEDSSSTLVVRPTEAVEVARAAEPMAAVRIRVGSEDLSLDRSTPSDFLGAMAMGHSPSLPSFSEEALKEARELNTLDLLAQVHSDIGDASLLLEEAHRFITRAIGRFRVDLSQCEAELRKVLGERDDLRLLSSKKEEAIKDLQADLAKVREERVELDQQLRNVKQKVSGQAKKIDELEIRLAEAKAEVESSKVLADKSIAYRFRRKTLEEIHARGFDLTEEVRKAKELEAEAEALASDDDDDDNDDGSKSGSEGGEDPDPEA
ncbi:uncharacterized protein [Nicotiana tomentosiformis]|uniref:uncharacterized protein n=1 Tax=Nicotiana tomentosiformis TaxID=4098 RepID=UPI00388CCA69